MAFLFKVFFLASNLLPTWAPQLQFMIVNPKGLPAITANTLSPDFWEKIADPAKQLEGISKCSMRRFFVSKKHPKAKFFVWPFV